MSTYNGQLRDMRLVLHEVFDAPAIWARQPHSSKVIERETAAAILAGAAKLTGQLTAPLNRSGDEEGPLWTAGKACIRAGSAPCSPLLRSSFDG